MKIIQQSDVDLGRFPRLAELSAAALRRQIQAVYEREGAQSAQLDQLLRQADAAARQRWESE